ncbi:MAG: YcaO-like family protein [Bdellovibrionaceae bacterium]|nr:YcaO-like family protein [Pseudobdellovibrionaceae bacterium]
MASQKTLTAWILQNDVRLDLQVQTLSWINPIFPQWYDLKVSISALGERFTGHGADPNADTALGKAVCEAVERATCFSYGISSLGVAGHFDPQLAEANARLEYVERLCFSRQISEGFVLKEIPGIDFFPGHHGYHGVDLRFYGLASPSDTSVVLCLATGLLAQPSFGGIMGLGASTELESARRKAFVECLRSLAFYFQAKPKSLSYENFQAIEAPHSLDRQALFRDTDYFRQILNHLSKAAPSALQIPKGKFESLSLDSVFGRCPLVFYRYSTPTSFVQPEFLA